MHEPDRTRARLAATRRRHPSAGLGVGGADPRATVTGLMTRMRGWVAPPPGPPEIATPSRLAPDKPEFEDGAALAVRVDAAERLLSDERDREASLNTRALAIGAVAGALFTLALRAVEPALAGRRAPLAHATLLVDAAVMTGAFMSALALAIFGVLQPSSRQSVDAMEFDHWLDAGMADTEAAARYSLLASTTASIKSRRDVNASKAKYLKRAYRAVTVMLVAALPHIAVIAL
jgi:hypothetical protein